MLHPKVLVWFMTCIRTKQGRWNQIIEAPGQPKHLEGTCFDEHRQGSTRAHTHTPHTHAWLHGGISGSCGRLCSGFSAILRRICQQVCQWILLGSAGVFFVKFTKPCILQRWPLARKSHTNFPSLWAHRFQRGVQVWQCIPTPRPSDSWTH